MKWKLPFTSRYARIEAQIEKLAAQIGEDVVEKTEPTSLWNAYFGTWCIVRSVKERLNDIEEKFGLIEDYLKISKKTTSEKTYYSKIVKKSK